MCLGYDHSLSAAESKPVNLANLVANTRGLIQHMAPVVRRTGVTGFVLAGINEFFVLHPTVWSHEVTAASETVTVLETRYLGRTRRFILQQFYNSA